MKKQQVFSVLFVSCLVIYFQEGKSASLHSVMAMLEPVKKDFSNLPLITNSVQAYNNFIPAVLKNMRANTKAGGKDFVDAVVGSLSTSFLGKGLFADSLIFFIKWFLSSLANVIPIEVVEYFLDRPLIMKDVYFVEAVVQDAIQVYDMWTSTS